MLLVLLLQDVFKTHWITNISKITSNTTSNNSVLVFIRNLAETRQLIIFFKEITPVSENSSLKIEFSTRLNNIKERYKLTLSERRYHKICGRYFIVMFLRIK